MLNGRPDQLDYTGLVRESRRLKEQPEQAKLRLALLGDCALQQIVPPLRSLLARASTSVEIYESGFDTADTEVYDRQSALYTFEPNVVVILDSVQMLRDAFFEAESKETFASNRVARLTGRWRAIEQHSKALIVQSNFATPLERPFGNFERKIATSLLETVASINRDLAHEARARRAVFINDVEFIASYLGRKAWFDEKLWCLAKSFCALDCLPWVAQNIVDILLATRGAGVKCVILDLDNTLWGGVIGDDGLSGIRVGHLEDGEAFLALQRLALELSRRGILLVVCSKNNFEDAVLPFRQHPEMLLREKDITLFVANWDDKARNIASIKETLQIGYDSMVFLDDNPFERNLVRSLLPDVIVPELPEDPAEVVKALSELNLFETAVHSSADADRAKLYQTARQREELKQSFASIDDYLQSLEMEIELQRFSEFDLPRIAQLIQRSNQFNLATRRYSEAECAGLMQQPMVYPFSVRLKDRFGDHGLISVVVLKLSGATAIIDEYLMSCRVLQRGVEQLVMNHIVEFAKAHGVATVEGAYLPTKKNSLVKDFYRQFGFNEVGSGPNGETRWSIEVAAFMPAQTYARRAPTLAAGPELVRPSTHE